MASSINLVWEIAESLDSACCLAGWNSILLPAIAWAKYDSDVRSGRSRWNFTQDSKKLRIRYLGGKDLLPGIRTRSCSALCSAAKRTCLAFNLCGISKAG